MIRIIADNEYDIKALQKSKLMPYIVCAHVTSDECAETTSCDECVNKYLNRVIYLSMELTEIEKQ